MMRLKNVSSRRIEQLFEEKTYIFEPGEVMDLPPLIAAWLLAKINSPSNNPNRKAHEREPWLQAVGALADQVPERVATIRSVPESLAKAPPSDPSPASTLPAGEEDRSAPVSPPPVPPPPPPENVPLSGEAAGAGGFETGRRSRR